MNTAAQKPASWPEGVIARYATVGGGTVDVSDYEGSPDGEPWMYSECLGCQDDEVSQGIRRANAFVAAKSWSQAHAERCRAMPKPDGA
ncbi:hypothetical protein [Spirillospora sp. NBC_01491]|uniref:hypothetical protein n=1 Tax=Spirillospora sp. NBC_01491 TaxID=2976007 RepID=UPI002E318958|nr:hypothetical protein [Spirillospora sp. NBC_01491]